MNYKILDTKYNYSRLNLKISFVPPNDVLNAFFASLDVIKLSEMLQNVVKSENYYQSPMSLRFYKELDWEDLEELDKIGGINKDEIVIYHEVYGETIIKELFFSRILLDYANKLMVFYRNDTILPINWFTEIQEGINNLTQKIESQA